MGLTISYKNIDLLPFLANGELQLYMYIHNYLSTLTGEKIPVLEGPGDETRLNNKRKVFPHITIHCKL